MTRLHLCLLSLCLTILGTGLFLYKAFVLDFPLGPEAQSVVWNVEAHVTFTAYNKPVKALLYIPRNSKRFVIVDENFISRGYGLTTTEQGEYKNRQALWSKRRAKGLQGLYYRCVVRRALAKETGTSSKPPAVEPPKFEGPHVAAAESFMSEIQEQSADTDSLVAELIKRLNKIEPNGNVALLLGKQPPLSRKVEVATQLLRYAHIPARVVQGIRLDEQHQNVPPLQWLEVYHGGQWRSYDPNTGESNIPDDYFAWWRGTDSVAQVNGGVKLRVGLAVSINQEQAIVAAVDRGAVGHPLLVGLSLFSLPLQTQGVYRVLLLVPVGAFLLVILRNVVGFNTFGTFMPVLIALAFRETQLLWGVTLFTVVVALGLSVRFYLEGLRLLVVPRLASVLIIVVFLLAALSVLTNKLGLERGLSVALFPMVILTMTIERMSVVWEERGATEALEQAAGSLGAAALCYVIMTLNYVEHLVFVFPELLLVLLAGTLLLGRYTGYRLLELGRFKALVK